MATNADALIYAAEGVFRPTQPGSRIAAYVRSTGVQSGDPAYIAENLTTTLNAALIRCRSGMNDVVVVLPGHDENVSSADQMSNLVAGTKILGIGNGADRPQLTWTVAAATFLFDVANVTLRNFVLNLCDTGNAGVTVAAPITVSAAGCEISDCQIQFGADANDIVTIGITTTAAADDFTFDRNFCYGATAAECTTFLRLVGADRFRCRDTTIMGATSSTTVGVVQFLTTASTQCEFRRSTFINRKALSVHAVTGLASCSGVMSDCDFGILDTATLAGFVTPADFMGFRNKTVNTTGEQGGETSTVSA